MTEYKTCIEYNKLPQWLGPLQLESIVGIHQKEAAAASAAFGKRVVSFQSPVEHKQPETASMSNHPSCNEPTKWQIHFINTRVHKLQRIKDYRDMTF